MPLAFTEQRVRFGQFELDLRTRQLTRNGANIRLSQQPIQVLLLLLEAPGEIVTREEFRRRLWPSDVFVDFDHGLNKSIQKLRDALGDSASSPRYIETIPRIGYRFIAPVNGTRPSVEPPPEAAASAAPMAPTVTPAKPASRKRSAWWALAAGSVAACVAGFFAVALYRARRSPPEPRFVQLTAFPDSAVAPALSPDGHTVAFIRGDKSFLGPDDIYVKMLPNGEARRVTEDHREKYGLAFSPDGTEIAYTVLERARFSTYAVSTLGGEPHLLLENSAGLSWLDRDHLLFSEIRPGEGIHMGLVTATVTRAGLREIYFPPHQRGMVHYSYPSPDRSRALVVEMNSNGHWGPCRLVDLEGQAPPRQIGPAGACSSAGWSTNGGWMYFTAIVEGRSHLWRQHFPDGEPEQLTFGPTEEDGVAMEPQGSALITSVGVTESALWLHSGNTERPLSSEGEVEGWPSPPVFSPDVRVLYYLVRQGQDPGAELQRTLVESGRSDVVLPGVSILAFDLSPDGKEVVYTTTAPGGTTQLWLAPVDGSNPPWRLNVTGAQSPHFGAEGRILFQRTEANRNYLEQVDSDGTHRSKVVPFPILMFQSVSPGRRWAVAIVPATPESDIPTVSAIPLAGGATRRISSSACFPRWSADGKFLFVPVENASRGNPGRSLAIPLGPDEELPDLPADGIAPFAAPSVVRGAISVSHEQPVPGKTPEQYAWVNTTVHRNLYRITLP